MKRIVLVLALLPASLAAADEPSFSAADYQLFESKVRPVLVERCSSCHSAAKKVRGGLRLDSRTELLTGGDSGPAIVPGRPERSLLIQAIRYQHETLQMPPKGKLSGQETAALEEWVRRGVPFPAVAGTTARKTVDLAAGRRFWSFQPLRQAALPIVADNSWPQRRIDPFLLHQMQQHGLKPSPPASSRTLIRRVYFDLVGLPPTPEEVEAFVHDKAADAYPRLVERLLASPHYGERWGRYWLDLARYCDVSESWVESKGKPHLYRDWVVRAFNEDLPYDRFVQLQLAADLMQSRPEDRAALGFLGLSPVYWKELKLDKEVIKTIVAEEWEERIGTISSTFLGLTVACARCHDHKFDAITQADYYALAGVLASTRQADRPLVPDKNAPLAAVVEDASLFVLADGPHHTRLDYRPGVAQDVAIQVRGNPSNPGPVVPRRFLTVLSRGPARPFRQGSGRLDLARAIVGDGAALAARVIVNRIWMHHFGAGLVATPSDFGTQGARPTHPELLDDLAARFIAAGWSLKWLHREIVLSAAYQQASSHDVRRHAIDPDNRWLWRMSRRRLDVESWRDAMLAAGGTLSRQMGGPAMDLGHPRNSRRTLYGLVRRRELNDLLRLNDFPDPMTHSAARVPTTTALQQLFTLNSPLLRHQADALARRLQAEATGTEARVRRAYALLFGRPPTDRELKLAVAFLTEGKPSAEMWVEYAQVLLGSNELLFVD